MLKMSFFFLAHPVLPCFPKNSQRSIHWVSLGNHLAMHCRIEGGQGELAPPPLKLVKVQ